MHDNFSSVAPHERDRGDGAPGFAALLAVVIFGVGAVFGWALHSISHALFR